MSSYAASPTIHIANQHLMAGQVIAYPTEAVWGLGCDPFNREALFSILSLKRRSPNKGVILIAAHIEQFDFALSGLSAAHLETLKRDWPGPHTWIVPRNRHIPWWIAGNHDGVALRVSRHPIVQALCRQYGGPIVSTSANPQGKQEARSHWQVLRYFKHHPSLTYCLRGPVGQNQTPSSIRELISGKIIR